MRKVSGGRPIPPLSHLPVTATEGSTIKTSLTGCGSGPIARCGNGARRPGSITAHHDGGAPCQFRREWQSDSSDDSLPTGTMRLELSGEKATAHARSRQPRSCRDQRPISVSVGKSSYSDHLSRVGSCHIASVARNGERPPSDPASNVCDTLGGCEFPGDRLSLSCCDHDAMVIRDRGGQEITAWHLEGVLSDHALPH